jgi:DnaJ-class molecular chaperone
MKQDLYRTLEVLPSASDEEVKRAYRRLAFLYHPDRNQAEALGEERIKEANYAYSVLGDRERRKRYDLYREFMNIAARWGIPPSPSQEKILADIFLDPKFPGVGGWLDQILREKGLTTNGSPFWAFSQITLRTLRHLYQEANKRRRPGTKSSRFRMVSYPKTVLRKVGSAFNSFGSGQRRGRW